MERRRENGAWQVETFGDRERRRRSGMLPFAVPFCSALLYSIPHRHHFPPNLDASTHRITRMYVPYQDQAIIHHQQR